MHRIQKGTTETIFIQGYYLVEFENKIIEQEVDYYELDENFTLVFVSAKKAIETNKFKYYEDVDEVEIEREAKVLELLIKEGYLK